MYCELTALIKNSLRRHRWREHGFTLLEILVALFILATIMTLIFGSFEGVFSNADHINAASDMLEMGSTCLNRISMDLQALHVMHYPRYRPPDIDDDPDIYRIEGTLDAGAGETFSRLRFTSLAHLPLNQDHRQGIARIVYYIENDGENGHILRRADHLFPYPEFEPSPEDPVLCEKVLSFRLVYHSVKGDEEEEWDSESDDLDRSTPKSIGITLTIGDAEAPYEFSTEVALPLYRFKEEDS
jgi:general secretion pathway protein J